MSEKGPLQELLKRELEVNKRLLEDKPVRAIKIFVENFDEDARQVPSFVLEFLAQRLSGFIRGDFSSLDEAFGGRAATQRNALGREERDFEVVSDLLYELEKTKKIRKAERTGTPFEMAEEIIADRYNTTTDNVRRIYKMSKLR